MQTLANADLDPMPLLGCLDLLLGNVKDAERHFAVLRDAELQAWFLNHPGDRLAAQCEYCRAWLERDVLPGYRDVDASVADLDAWFADRDVQSYVDRLDRKASRQPDVEDMPLAWSAAAAASLDSSSELNEADPETDSDAAESPPSFWRQRWIRPAAGVVVVVGIALGGLALVRRNMDQAPLMPETASESPEAEVEEAVELDAPPPPLTEEPRSEPEAGSSALCSL